MGGAVIPCYQICKDRSCPYWNLELLDCDLLPDSCEFAIDHLVSDRENQYIDGKEHGFWDLELSDKIVKLTGRYINGNREGVWREMDIDGVLESEQEYKDGRFTRNIKSWYKNGHQSYEIRMLDSGVIYSREWWENGQLRTEEFYKNEKKDGVCRWWGKTGQLRYEESFINGERDGICRHWDEKGKLQEERHFVMGKLVGVCREFSDNEDEIRVDVCIKGEKVK